ncbi:MAG: NAD(P)/FAD-dependent oxidoreductase [Legionella sp.]|nr:NAD(P)/FAD-dependent oxidoreductase [Legionella sp.]
MDEIKYFDEEFLLKTKNRQVKARNVILATGVKDIEPILPNLQDGINRGLIRHCPVCDGYEVINKKVGVIGEGTPGVNEALFLRHYTPDLFLINLNNYIWKKSQITTLKEAQITLINENPSRIKLTFKSAKIEFPNHGELVLDSIYSALGSIKNTKLAEDLYCKFRDGFLVVDKNYETSIKGFYAAGDIVLGLNQICVAESHAAIAATAIHNKLLSDSGF